MNIVIRGVNWLGDTIMSIPAIRGIRELHPDARISILVRKKVAPIFEIESSIDEIIVYEPGLKGKLKGIKNLKDGGFQRAYLLQNALDAALIAFIAGIPERVGWDRDCRGFLLTHRVPYNREDRKMHHINYFFEIPRRFNPSLLPQYPWINPALKDRISSRNELKSLKRPILAIAPGAKYGVTKRWEGRKFIEIIRRFTKNFGSVVVLGQNDDRLSFNSQEREELKEHLFDFTGKTSLYDLISLLSECDLLLCNDSGIMHLGYALGVPLVAIFGSTSPELTGPPRLAGKVVRSAVECSPCFKSRCSHIRCMESIDVEEVWNALLEIIPTKRAVFFDRDGTLCRDAHYLSRWEDFEALSHLDKLQELKELGFLLIGITNQSGIARGIIKEDFVREVNQLFIDKYSFDDFFYCPHHPQDSCFCRKPKPALALVARYKYRIDFKKSYMVGDKEIDMEFANTIGAKGILIGRDANNLAQVVEIIKRDLNVKR